MIALAPLTSPARTDHTLLCEDAGTSSTSHALVMGSFLWDRGSKCLTTTGGTPLIRSVITAGGQRTNYTSPYPGEWTLGGDVAVIVRCPEDTGDYCASVVSVDPSKHRRELGPVSASLLGFRQSHLPSPVRVIGPDAYCWLQPSPTDNQPRLSLTAEQGGSHPWPNWFLTEVLTSCSVTLSVQTAADRTLDHRASGVVTDLFTDPRSNGVVFLGLCRSVPELLRLFLTNHTPLYRLHLPSKDLQPLGQTSRERLHHRWCGDRILVAEARASGTSTTLVDLCQRQDAWQVDGTLDSSDGVPGRAGCWTCLEFPDRLFTGPDLWQPLPAGWRLVTPRQQGLDMSVLRSRMGALAYVSTESPTSPDLSRGDVIPVSLSGRLVARVHKPGPTEGSVGTRKVSRVRQTLLDPGAWGNACALRTLAGDQGSRTGFPLVWVTTTGLGFGDALPSDPVTLSQGTVFDSEALHWRHGTRRPVYEVVMSPPRWAASATFDDYLGGVGECLDRVLHRHEITDYALGGYSFGASLVGITTMSGRLTPRHVILRSGGYDRHLTPQGFQWERRPLPQAPDVYRGFTLLGRQPAAAASWTIEHGLNDTNAGTPWTAARALYETLHLSGVTCHLFTGHGVGHCWPQGRLANHLLQYESAALDRTERSGNSLRSQS